MFNETQAEAVETSTSTTSKRNYFDRLSFTLLIITVFLSPLVFIPGSAVALQSTKVLFITILLVLSLFSYLFARVKTRTISLPRSLIFPAALAVLGIFLIAALVSPTVSVSLLGQGSEVGTFGALAIFFLAFFLVSFSLEKKERLLYVYMALFAAFAVTALFQISRFIFGPSFLSFGIFGSTTANTVGSWYDLGIFAAVMNVLSFLSLELLSWSKKLRMGLWAVFVVSLLLLVVVNFELLYVITAIVSVLFLVYNFSMRRGFRSAGSEPTPAKKIPYTALATFIIAAFFSLGALTSRDANGTVKDNFIGRFEGSIARKLSIANIEVRPNFSGTMHVAKETLSSRPILGAGLNRFMEEWVKFKPLEVNRDLFWNTDFDYGYGLLPTFVVTSGILGTLALLFFFGTYLVLGFRALFRGPAYSLTRYFVVSSFLSSLFLWVMAAVYIPSFSILFLTFFLTGVFVLSLFHEGTISLQTIPLPMSSKGTFVSIVAGIVVILAFGSIGIGMTKRYVGSYYYSKALVTYNTEGNLDKTEAALSKAKAAFNSDVYARGLTDLYLVRLSSVVQTAGQAPTPATINSFQTYLKSAITAADEAVAYDSTNYQNWLNRGKIYESLLPLRIPGAITEAEKNYSRASDFNPTSPAMPLIVARMYATNGAYKKSEEFIQKALQLKNNYTDAAFLLTQVQVQEGNLTEAIRTAEATATLEPTNAVFRFQLGLLYYNTKEYMKAGQQFEQAVILNESYSNARFFLGLSYSKLGHVPEAIAQFTRVAELNPDNKEVQSILSNLKAGRPPYAPGSEPEKQKTVPIPE